ncbi:hypothetical protein H5410_042225 [Solanum commersonii]|uniref:Uncharacterized protein n=1 Tax=Solanum commersonii TaxID=4109 RepID=A0A9J5XVS5_SOLCO|nr:hypothetical protein H5410_042225 [Solanum commersonii]
MASFQGQTSPEQANPHFFYLFLCAIVHGFLSRRENRPILMVKRAQSRQIPIFADFRLLVSTSKPAIFKVKRAPEQENPHFCLFLCAIIHAFLVIWSFDVFFTETFPTHPLRPYPWIFGDPKFQRVFCQNISWTSVKTIVMELVGPNGAGKPPFLLIFVCYNPYTFGDPEFQCDFCQIFLWVSFKTLVMEPVSPDGQTDPFSRTNEPQSRQTPIFCQFSCAI